MDYFYRLNLDSLERPALPPARGTVAAQDSQTPLWKLVFDKLFALTACLFFAPLILFLVTVIYFKDGGKVLFRHTRIGQNGKPFNCLKFRTMVLDAEQQLAEHLKNDPEARKQWDTHRKLEDDPRVTCLGRFLRKTSLDELPQFWNVLRGDMSIVGPRPITMDETAYYDRDLPYYYSVKPGITGLWQISGRSSTGYKERVAMDVDYAAGYNLKGDLKIVSRTVKVVLTGRGAC